VDDSVDGAAVCAAELSADLGVVGSMLVDLGVVGSMLVDDDDEIVDN
jgi:hypothetical protein